MTDSDPSDPAPDAETPVEHAIGRAVTAFARALRLSCRAAGGPPHPTLANDAVAAHLAARAWAEEAVHRACAAPARRHMPER